MTAKKAYRQQKPDPNVVQCRIPGIGSPVRGALSSCAIEGNTFAIEALETIRRVECGEPVGLRYVEALDEIMEKAS